MSRLSDEECSALAEVLAWDAFTAGQDDRGEDWTWECPGALKSRVPLGPVRGNPIGSGS